VRYYNTINLHCNYAFELYSDLWYSSLEACYDINENLKR